MRGRCNEKSIYFFFFFNDTATTEIYTLSLHDALPIFLNKLYVLMENADGLVLVDQHAAHERILFEELRRRMEEQGVPTQKLLLPQTFNVPPRDADWIERNLSVLQRMGIGIESFGPNTFKIDSV